MQKIYYNKLCRDKIPDLIRAKGFECDVREVDADEYRREIARKVAEEASGVSNDSGRSGLVKELADLLVTIEALKKEYGLTEEEIDAAIEASIEEKGGYEDRLFLSWSSDTEYSSNDQRESDRYD